MIDDNNLKRENNNILDELKQPKFSSKSVTNQNILKAQKLQKEIELEADAKQKAHNRQQSFEDIKNNFRKNIYRGILPFILALLLLWVICCAINATEIKTGVELVLSTVSTLIIGVLIGKHI